MRALRQTRNLVRFALAWFVLSLGVAIASPMVNPVSMQLVCTAMGSVKMVVQSDDGSRELGATHLDCPMCMLTGGLPPPPQTVVFPVVQPLGHAVQSIPAAHIAAATAAPLPPRGPPARS